MLTSNSTKIWTKRYKSLGWVEQSLNENDNRNTDVYLSASGLELSEKVMSIGSRQLHRAVKDLNEEQLKDLVGLLKKLVLNLSKLPIE